MLEYRLVICLMITAVITSAMTIPGTSSHTGMLHGSQATPVSAIARNNDVGPDTEDPFWQTPFTKDLLKDPWSPENWREGGNRAAQVSMSEGTAGSLGMEPTTEFVSFCPEVTTGVMVPQTLNSSEPKLSTVPSLVGHEEAQKPKYFSVAHMHPTEQCMRNCSMNHDYWTDCIEHAIMSPAHDKCALASIGKANECSHISDFLDFYK